ncbi:MAG: GntR family transcriptional regulator [SAR324 cluster bacterium]|nr:GntR family transcriptional regulator [SAR324 cluster bacterium]
MVLKKKEHVSKNRPLYLQISELLQREIAAGHWRVGERLPIEAELAKDLSVAVGTLRKALSELQKIDLLERRQGSGTYVLNPPQGAIYQLFRLELSEGGGKPHAETLSVKIAQDPEALNYLGLKTGSKMWRIRRLRYLNTVLVAAEEMWLDQCHAESLKPEDLHESLYKHYREHFDFWISRVEDRIRCQEAPPWSVDLLGVTQGTVLGFVERMSWSNRDRIEEYSRTWYKPEICHYVSRFS